MIVSIFLVVSLDRIIIDIWKVGIDCKTLEQRVNLPVFKSSFAFQDFELPMFEMP